MSTQTQLKTAESLTRVLADTYALYLKTQNYHWNVTGPNFHSLHLLFGQQYEQLSAAVDEVAERIRALGVPAPGSFGVFSKLTTIQDEKDVPTAEGMLQRLLDDHGRAARTAEEARKIAEAEGDSVSEDLMIGRIAEHEKNQWMLRSLIA